MFTYEIWDKKSKINGVAAKTILSDSRYKTADAVLLIRDGTAVVQLQAFQPGVAGNVPMSADEAIEVGERIVAERKAALLLNEPLLIEETEG